MLMLKSSDLLQTGADRAAGLRWIYADVTDSARELARSHLCGPAAELALAESLAAVALLGADLEQPEETVSLHIKTDGPIGSVLVEAAFDGALRGFPAKKILNEFDGEQEPDMQAVVGNAGEVRIIRSVPGCILAQSGFQLPGPRPAEAVSQFFNIALQRRGIATVVAVPGGDGVDRARAFFLECLPGGDEEAFSSASALLGREGFSEALDAAQGAFQLCEELGMKGIVSDDPRPLRFGCRCSRDRARETLRALSKEELADMAKSGHDTDIYCHMCGKCYSFKPEELSDLGN